MDDDYEYEEPEEVKFVDEVNAYARAGGNPFTAYYKKTEATTGYEQKRRLYAVDEDKFVKNLERLYLSMRDNQSRYTPSNEDINTMLTKLFLVPALKYKNATAYMLGYMASHGGRDNPLDAKQVKYVITDILPSLGPNIGVTPPDVIRYARFWSMYLS